MKKVLDLLVTCGNLVNKESNMKEKIKATYDEVMGNNFDPILRELYRKGKVEIIEDKGHVDLSSLSLINIKQKLKELD